ncbi:MAG: hypothetical protein CMG62_02335 [Candidatus Marinimicrobia bacterium]|nr:hypothetical protein [Candidatus Neomarinimicrobiota bacterium]
MLSALIPTYNNSSNIIETLESIKWADEIIVIDSFSSDDTLNIVESYGARVYRNKYVNSAKQKNWGLKHCKYEWIFQIDTDEVLEKDSEKLIRSAIKNVGKDIHCFKMARKNHVLGKWVKYGGLYPDWEFRLFRKKYGRWKDREVHSRIIVSGKIEILNTSIIHNGMPNVSKQISNLDRYTRYEADELNKRKQKYLFLNLFFRPFYVFLKRYIYMQGFRDGWRGYFLAIYASFYVFVSYTKLLEIKLLSLKRSPK